VRVLVELELEEAAPEDVVAALAHPFPEPAGAFDLVEGAPVGDALREEHVQAVAELADEVEARELEERERVAPVVELPVEIEAHLRLDPAQLLVDPDSRRYSKYVLSGAQMKW
jgi:hypothetical protein